MHPKLSQYFQGNRSVLHITFTIRDTCTCLHTFVSMHSGFRLYGPSIGLISGHASIPLE